MVFGLFKKKFEPLSFWKLLIRILLTGFLGGIFAWVVAALLAGLTNTTGIVIGALISLVIVVLFFKWSQEIHPGEERYIKTDLLLVLAATGTVITLFGAWGIAIPIVTIGASFDAITAVVTLGSIWLADSLIQKYIVGL